MSKPVVLLGFMLVMRELREWLKERSTLEAMPIRKYPHPLSITSPLVLTLLGS